MEFRHVTRLHTPQYAIWHRLYAVTRCYPAFFLVLMYVVYGKLPEGHELHTSRKLIFKERLFASLLVVADKVRDMLNPQVTAISRRARPHSVATQLQFSHLNACAEAASVCVRAYPIFSWYPGLRAAGVGPLGKLHETFWMGVCT